MSLFKDEDCIKTFWASEAIFIVFRFRVVKMFGCDGRGTCFAYFD